MNIRVSVLKLQLGAARLAPPRLVLEVGGTLGLGHLKDGEGHFRVTIGYYRITKGHYLSFFKQT